MAEVFHSDRGSLWGLAFDVASLYPSLTYNPEKNG
jgi:hypothetical protein